MRRYAKNSNDAKGHPACQYPLPYNELRQRRPNRVYPNVIRAIKNSMTALQNTVTVEITSLESSYRV